MQSTLDVDSATSVARQRRAMAYLHSTGTISPPARPVLVTDSYSRTEATGSMLAAADLPSYFACRFLVERQGLDLFMARGW
jgi:hypothetical protein